jgi:hypothetical protein
MRQHITVVAAIRIGFSALWFLIAMIAFVALFGTGLLTGNEDARSILTIIGTAVASFFVLLSVPGIIAGIGLFRYQPWARILTMVLAFLDLFNIPVGTAVGAYTIWVLMQEETAQLFNRV